LAKPVGSSIKEYADEASSAPIWKMLDERCFQHLIAKFVKIGREYGVYPPLRPTHTRGRLKTRFSGIRLLNFPPARTTSCRRHHRTFA